MIGISFAFNENKNNKHICDDGNIVFVKVFNNNTDIGFICHI